MLPEEEGEEEIFLMQSVFTKKGKTFQSKKERL